MPNYPGSSTLETAHERNAPTGAGAPGYVGAGPTQYFKQLSTSGPFIFTLAHSNSPNTTRKNLSGMRWEVWSRGGDKYFRSHWVTPSPWSPDHEMCQSIIVIACTSANKTGSTWQNLCRMPLEGTAWNEWPIPTENIQESGRETRADYRQDERHCLENQAFAERPHMHSWPTTETYGAAHGGRGRQR